MVGAMAGGPPPTQTALVSRWAAHRPAPPAKEISAAPRLLLGVVSRPPPPPHFSVASSSVFWVTCHTISCRESVAGGAGLLTSAPLLHGRQFPSVGLRPPNFLQRNCCGGCWSPYLPPPFFVAGSSPPWGSGHSVSCRMTGLVATPVEAGPSATPGEAVQAATLGEAEPATTPGDSSSGGPSGGDGSSGGPLGGDGNSGGTSGGELGRGAPGHGGSSGSSTSPSYPVTVNAEQQAAHK
ncbi:UNVERIFIED_CONTAM: hypothetical protein FKN15_029632 [Acipenser sinensis]